MATKKAGAKPRPKVSKLLSERPEPGQARLWAWTLNNYSQSEEDFLRSLVPSGVCNYMKFGHEICPTTGTPHLQGVLGFPGLKTKPGALKACACIRTNGKNAISMAPTYASLASNMKYTGKDGQEVFEAGVPPMDPKSKGQCSKERTVAILTLAKAGNFAQLEAEYPEAWFYQQRAIMSARGHVIRNNVSLDGILENYWIFGESGQGKGMYVDTLTTNYFTKAADEKWWCGYDGQTDVLLDDLGKGILPLMGKFKLWTDRKPFNAEVKGGNWLIRPTRVFVTSHWHPSEIIHDPDDLAAVMRRFQLVEIVDHQPVELERVNVTKPVLKPLIKGVWSKASRDPTPMHDL